MSERIIKRVLGIDPFSRGVGFAVLEGPDCLVDWGLKSSGKADSAKAAHLIQALIERYQPDILAVEDWDATGSRRCERVRKLLNRIASRGTKSLRVRLITARQLRTLGPRSQVNTKFGRASFLAGQFAELRAFLPRFRKPWMSEEDRMAIFDALAFAVTCFPTQAPVPLLPSPTSEAPSSSSSEDEPGRAVL
jgi:RNase H-fold protein (predicted Holliday junction resolvase)